MVETEGIEGHGFIARIETRIETERVCVCVSVFVFLSESQAGDNLKSVVA